MFDLQNWSCLMSAGHQYTSLYCWIS